MTVTDLGLRKRDYKGLKFFDLTYDVPVRTNVTFSISEREKYVMRDAALSFDRHENSYRYNDEVVISVWSNEAPVLEVRAENETAFRCEIPVPLLTFTQMCAVAQDRIWNYRTSIRKPSDKVAVQVADFL